MRRVKFSLLAIAAVFLASVSSAQSGPPRDYLASVINVTRVETLSTNCVQNPIHGLICPRRITYQVRQAFSTPNKFMPINSPGNLIPPIQYESTKVFLNSETHTTASYNWQRTIPASVLNPAETQDQGYGFFNANFNAGNNLNARANFIENISGEGAYFVVGTRFNVLDPTFYPAPNFTGPLVVDLIGGADNDYNLSPFIVTAPGHGVHCVLREHSASFGLASNPEAGGLDLFVTTDCRIRWNTISAQVGTVYAIQVRLFDKVNGQVPQNGAVTELDLAIQVGCAAGDLSCLQCGDRDMNGIKSNVSTANIDLVKLVSNARARLRTLSRKRHRLLGPTSLIERRKYVKNSNLLRRTKTETNQADFMASSIITGIPSSLADCLRPSELFCIPTDNSSVRTGYFVEANRLLGLYNPLVKNMTRAIRYPGDKRAKAKARNLRTKWDRSMQETFGRMVSAWETYPGVLYSCSDTPL